jgi:serine/threonine-protein kinase
MLSASPEARGSARELAEALEQAAREVGPEADEPLFEREESEPAPTRYEPPRVAPGGRARAVSLRRVAGGLGAALALGAAWLLSAHPGGKVEEGLVSRPEEMRDGGTVAVGDEALTAPVPLSQPPFARSTLAVDPPPRPFPGQRRPDASGRCPDKRHVPIHGGCWIKLPLDLKDCGAEGYYIYKGGCYVPVMLPARPPTSSPVERSGDTAE